VIEILYEHPEWFNLLFAELDRRGIEYSKRRADQILIDPENREFPALVLNRMSPSAYNRGHANAIFTARDYLAHMEHHGVPVVNGVEAYSVEISKSRQLDLFRSAGVRYPKARVINHASRAMEAAQGLRFPVVVKPNIGGSGAGIVRFDSPEQLAAAELNLGIDSTALVQEYRAARDGFITRIEILNGEFLYAIRIYPDLSSFNLCPADICQVDFGACPVPAAADKKKLRIERADPPFEAVAGALTLAKAASLDVGGIEFLIDDEDGAIRYYDINALSNFVTDAVNIVGFDPTARFVDYLESRVRAYAN
jgi:hypothetical protein